MCCEVIRSCRHCFVRLHQRAYSIPQSVVEIERKHRQRGSWTPLMTWFTSRNDEGILDAYLLTPLCFSP